MPDAMQSPRLVSDWLQPILALVPLLLCGIVELVCLATGDTVSDETLYFLIFTSNLFCALALLRAYFTIGRASEMGLLIYVLGFVYWFFAPAAALAFSGEGWADEAAHVAIDRSDRLDALFAINLYFVMVLWSYQLRRGERLVRLFGRLFGKDVFLSSGTTFGLSLILTVLCFGFYVALSGGFGEAIEYMMMSRATSKPWSSHGNFGTLVTPFHYLAATGLIFTAIISFKEVLMGRASLIHRAVLLVIWAMTTTWIALGSGTRSNLLMCVGPPLLLYFRQVLSRRRISKYLRIGFVGGMLLLTLLAASYQRSYRDTRTFGGQPLINIEENDFFTQTAFGMAVSRELDRWVMDSVAYCIVTGAIPRVLWKGKPYLRSHAIYTNYMKGSSYVEHGGNTIPSIVGQYFMNWGWLGILEIGLFIGILLKIADTAFLRDKRSMMSFSYVALLAYLFLSFRALAFSFFQFVLLINVGIWLIKQLQRFRRTGQAPATS